MFFSANKKKGITLDPRTKLFMMVMICTSLISGCSGPHGMILRCILIFIPFILYLCAERILTAIRYALVITALLLAEAYVLPKMTGTFSFIVLAFTGIITRMYPGLSFGAYIFSTTTVSEFVAGMERMHITQKIIIPFSVMFRFFPTLSEESKAIHDAMKMRGINPLSIENNLVPLMMTAVKTGDELSAASLTRGLGSPTKRTNMCVIGFHIQDVIFFIPTLICFVLSLIGF